MKKNKIKTQILKNKYNCIKYPNSQLYFFNKFRKELMLEITSKQFSKTDMDYIYNSSLFEKLTKNLMLKGNKYKVRKFIYRAFKNYKYIVKIHPIFIYFYIIYYFIVLIDFKKVQKSGNIIHLPRSIIGEEIFLLRTIKLFSKTLKTKFNLSEDLQTKIFSELFNLTFFIKRSQFYNVHLYKYYLDTSENIKYINYKW